MKEILGLTPEKLQDDLLAVGIKPYVARQVFSWVFDKGCENPEDWSNISRENRRFLHGHYRATAMRCQKTDRDVDGTQKLLLALEDGQSIESVLIEEAGHKTFCLSTQVGCPLGCLFCSTGRMGWQRNLTAAEILGQIFLIKKACPPEVKSINLVFMGMGEPLLNYDHLACALKTITSPWGFSISPRHITVSTAGIISPLRRLEKEFPLVKIAFSLNAADASLREKLMPHSSEQKLETILSHFRRQKRKHRITFEYVLIKGVNDSADAARQLARLIRGISAKINLIPLNETPGHPFQPPEEEGIVRFQKILVDLGYTVIVRWSKGRGIRSACGQLATAITGICMDSQKPL